MATLINSAEGGTNGTAVIAGNSGGASGDAFDLVVKSGTGSIAFSNAQAAHGTLSYAIGGPSGSDTAYVRYTSAVTGSTAALRFYLYLNAIPSGTIDLAEIRNSGGIAVKYQLRNTGVALVADAAGTTLNVFNATPLTTGTWYRLELQCVVGTSTSTGTVGAQYFLRDSLSAIDTYSSTTMNAGTTALTGMLIGKANVSGGSLDAYVDEVAYNPLGALPLGPASDSPLLGWFSF